MDYNFTDKDVLNKVIELGNQFPDYSYTSPGGDDNHVCRYTDGADGQGCIVGQALRALGVPYAVLAGYDLDLGAGVPASDVLAELLDESYYSGVRAKLDNIQYKQDLGYPWGQCVR